MAKEADQVNEGEGSKTAARAYNKAQRRFAESQPVEEKAREAERALDGPEAQELAEAEAIGRRHITEEDPAVYRDYHEKVKARAHQIWKKRVARTVAIASIGSRLKPKLRRRRLLVTSRLKYVPLRLVTQKRPL